MATTENCPCCKSSLMNTASGAVCPNCKGSGIFPRVSVSVHWQTVLENSPAATPVKLPIPHLPLYTIEGRGDALFVKGEIERGTPKAKTSDIVGTVKATLPNPRGGLLLAYFWHYDPDAPKQTEFV